MKGEGTNMIIINDMRIEYEYDEDMDFHIYTIKIFPDTDNCLSSRCYIVAEMISKSNLDIIDLFIDENIQRGLIYYENTISSS